MSDLRKEVIRLATEGKTDLEVAKMVGVHRSYVQSVRASEGIRLNKEPD